MTGDKREDTAPADRVSLTKLVGLIDTVALAVSHGDLDLAVKRARRLADDLTVAAAGGTPYYIAPDDRAIS